jgi:hypothetical protein
MRVLSLGVACLLGMTITPAQAKKYVVLDPSCNVTMPCEGGFYSERAKKFIGIPFGMPLQHYIPQRPKHQAVPVIHSEAVIGGRPSGCPHAYCGCSASLYLFGAIKPDLNLAANWLRFPRTSPAPRMAAARHGHVMVLVEARGGSNWLVHDGNSGRGLTRLHVRSIAGYTIVNPNS